MCPIIVSMGVSRVSTITLTALQTRSVGPPVIFTADARCNCCAATVITVNYNAARPSRATAPTTTSKYSQNKGEGNIFYTLYFWLTSFDAPLNEGLSLEFA